MKLTKTQKIEYIKRNWHVIGNKKIYKQDFQPNAWSYNDILEYFRKNGFPKRRKTNTELLYEELNIYKVRHILRNDMFCDEAILLAFVQMKQRAQYLEKLKEEQKAMQIFLMIVGVVLIVVSAAFSGGSTLALVSSIIGAIAGAGSIITGIVNIVLSEINEEKIKEQNNKTRDLALKNMPKSGNFIDTSITDPYSMYANGRLYKQGGAGRGYYDCLRAYEPYKYLDDDFSNSDIFPFMDVRNENKAGGIQYFSSLDKDIKWSNKESLNALLNGQTNIYLNIRLKSIETIIKWLNKEDLGTYYLDEKRYDKDYEWNRFKYIEFQDEKEIRGYTDLCVFYGYSEIIDSDGVVRDTIHIGSPFSVKTKHTQKKEKGSVTKEYNITKNIHTAFIKKETKILQGKDIHLYYMTVATIDIESMELDYSTRYIGSPYAKPQSYYMCEYSIYNYGGIKVIIYHSLQEIKNYTKTLLEANFIYAKKITLKQSYFHKPTSLIWKVTEQLDNVGLRFKSFKLLDTSSLFIKEEVQSLQYPLIKDTQGIIKAPSDLNNKNTYEYNIFLHHDKSMQFANITRKKGGKLAIRIITLYAKNPQKRFIKTTIYYTNKDDCDTTYFGMSDFLDLKLNATSF